MINENILDKYKKILSIKQEKIELKKNPLISRQAELDFKASTRTWIIHYNITQNEFPFVHELGHIYFAVKKSGFIYFALPPPPNPKLNRILGGLISNLLDGFVNYSLSEFKKIYPIIGGNVFLYLDNLREFQKNIENINNLFILLEWFILFYLDFRFILRELDRNKKNQKIESFLNSLKFKILDSGRFNQNNLNEFIESLNKFNEVKNETHPISIITFFIEVLSNINIWTEEELKFQMNLFFPNFESC